MIFLADLPKPIHGMSLINKSLLAEFDVAGFNVKVINTVPSYASVAFGTNAWGGVKFFHSIICLLRLLFLLIVMRPSFVYRPINGGFGQIYDFLYILLVRVFGADLIIHHHSFNYINRHSRLFKRLHCLAGSNAIHVVLGQVMADRLSELYDIPKNKILLLSNIVFFDRDLSQDDVGFLSIRIGHLANLCVDKGINDFVDVCRCLAKRGVNFQATIAGPFADDLSKEIVSLACEELPCLKYVGPLYGTKKNDFFKELDVFIFPSRYSNEAEPLVLYEAGQFGVFNIGTQRGCMSSVIKSLGGLSLEESDDLVMKISGAICNINDEGELSMEKRIERINLFIKMKLDAEFSLRNLFEIMKNLNVSKTK